MADFVQPQATIPIHTAETDQQLPTDAVAT